VKVNAGQDINVARSTITAQPGGGGIVTSGLSPGTPPKKGINLSAVRHINITDSTQLQVLASDPNALLRLASETGNINIDASTLQSGKDIEIEAMKGNVSITNSTLAGDIIKARTLGPNGQLIIGGTTFNATTLLRLYAEGGSGLVNFIANTALKGANIDIAGNTVQITNPAGGGTTVVSIDPSSNFRVYTNTDNYNKAGFGTFTDGVNQKGSTLNVDKHPFKNRPTFK